MVHIFLIARTIIMPVLCIFVGQGLIGMEKPPTEAAPLLRSSYSSFAHTDAPPDDIELGQQQDFKKRKSTLITGISKKDIDLCRSSFQKEFEWVNKLYLTQAFGDNRITKTAHEQLQEKLRFTHQVFQEINAAIERENARLELGRKISAPGQLAQACRQYGDGRGTFCDYGPQWINLSATVCAVLLTTLYCVSSSPSLLETQDPCQSLPQDPVNQMLGSCVTSSVQTDVPCQNSSMVLIAACCQDLVDALCLKNVTYYNHHVYPAQMVHAWKPDMILIPSVFALQGVIQLAGCYYRRAHRSHENIKQLVDQKKTDLTYVQGELKTFTITDNSTFEQL